MSDKPKCGDCADRACREDRSAHDSPFDPALDADPDCFVPRRPAEPNRATAEAVDLLRTADDRLSELIAFPALSSAAHERALFIQWQVRAALDALLSAPAAEPSEPSV